MPSAPPIQQRVQVYNPVMLAVDAFVVRRKLLR